MKKQLFFAALLLCGALWVAQAQTQEKFLTVEYTSQGTIKTDDFSFEGGIVQILNNMVMIIFPANPVLNRIYLFDDINTMNFEQRDVSIVKNVDTEYFKAYFYGGILHITAAQTVGKVNVYSIIGAWVAGIESYADTAQINLSALPKGVYVVQIGARKVKIIK
ncbi:MAG: T9SS type A sorting domain-containing protein [Bacteroidetes bacterium]|nr:T9SS type A sorting domain-containing protein [Bacteroidota bacterium]MCL2301695.1 T9SS type A sorting domain-containing protein [Lentimicrobiaceae bacterium]